MATSFQDPFHVVKDELSQRVASLKDKKERFQVLLETTDTSKNQEFKECRRAMVRDLKAAEKQLRDLTLTVELVQKDRAQFAHIDDFELENRTGYIAKTRDEVRTLTAYFKGDNVKQKMVADERQAVAEQARSLGATNSDEAENTHFIVDKQAEARMIMQQQDEDLTELGQGVDRLNELSMGINEELQTQNRMLSDLDRDIDEAAEKMNFVMGKMAKLLKTKDTCQICVVLALTFILCLLVFLVIYT